MFKIDDSALCLLGVSIKDFGKTACPYFTSMDTYYTYNIQGDSAVFNIN